ncbi:MAG: helix-turn-helix domain-containing protein [Actinobacteria bacterium]|nr:helix-turn-helix domain-containing protein [Actinomycetota bacterium]
MRSKAGIASSPSASGGEIEGLVELLSPELDEIATTLADTVHEHLTELDEDMRPWTEQVARANLGVIVTMMREGDDPASVEPPPEAVGYAREYAVRGLELSLMQRAYRTGQGVLGGIVLERLRTASDDADLLANGMAYFNAWIFAYVEAIERRLSNVYVAEQARWVDSGAAVRAAEVRALLADPGAVDPLAVSLRLGYELDRFHLGFVVWSEAEDERPGDAGALFARMERVAGAVARSLGSEAPLTVAEGRHLACWAGRRSAPDVSRLRLPRTGARGLSVAAGTPADGPWGFALSHREALSARRAAQMRDDADGVVVTYPDLALEALLTEDAEAGRRFVARELGPLGAADDPTVRLASTLAVFLEEGSSFVRAGRRLGIHANTVAYRVRRAEVLLGRPVTERQLELRVALRLGWLAG